MAQDNLSHAEVWDDSALVSSWNEALAEYKKYHSIAARGEKVELVVEEAHKPVVNSLPVENQAAQVSQTNKKTQAEMTATKIDQLEGQKAANSPHPALAATLPQAVLNGVQDEGLKSLMMSWYYAGYYTGVYEGKQQAFASLQPSE